MVSLKVIPLVISFAMPLSLRTKLILTMSAVVAGATIGTSVLTQGYVRRMYQQKFEEDFKAEVRYFSNLQLGRLSDLRGRCRKLATSSDLAAALGRRDKTRIQSVIGEELKQFLSSTAPGPGQGSGPSSGPRGNGTPGSPQFKGPLSRLNPTGRPDVGMLRETDRPIIGVVDEDGETICLIDSEGRLMPLDEAKNALGRRLSGEKDKLRGKELPPDLQLRETQRMQFRASMHKLASGVNEEQEIAYAAAKGFDGKQHLRELIVTPVMEKSKGEKSPVGAIIVSVLTSDLGERALHSFSQATDVQQQPDATGGKGKKHHDPDEGISSGFWLEGKLHTETIPMAVRDEVAAAVQKKLEENDIDGDFREITLPLAINNEAVPHKILYRVLNPDSPFPPACQVAIYSLKAEIAEEHAMMKQIGSVGVLSLALALLIILFLSRGLTKPIHDLVKATELIRQGDYDVTVPVQSKDEVGQLATSFNEMAEGLRLNQKYQRLLSQVTDRMVAEQLINSSEAALGGELREVSVLFCDIRGFTTLTAGMPPHDVISLLNEHMTALTSIVHKDSGVVDKFVGDMVMALFGAPFAYGDDAARAAQCALRMVEIRDRLNKSGRWQFQVGIGIATGTVVAGCMGSSERLDYTVLGDRVNLASRLCGQASEGCILIDDTTREHLGDAAEVEKLEGLALKGFPEGVTAYRLISLDPSKLTPKTPEG